MLFAVLLEVNIAPIIHIMAIRSGHMGLTSLIIANDLRVSTCGQMLDMHTIYERVQNELLCNGGTWSDVQRFDLPDFQRLASPELCLT